VFSKINSLFAKDGEGMYTAIAAIEPGEQILSTKVSLQNADTGIANVIPQGLKALAVNFDNIGAKVISPGTRIDIISVISYADSDRQVQEAAYLVAQDILVLAVGDKYIGASKKKNEESDRSPIITLAVSVEEAQIILLAGEKGSLKYIIRPAGDSEKINVKPMRLSDVAVGLPKNALKADRQKPQNAPHNEILDLITRYAGQDR